MSAGAILQITSYSVAQMIVGRIVAGIGNGINTATASTLIPWHANSDGSVGTSLADRDLGHQMARQIGCYRANPQHRRIFVEQLGHLRLLLY